LIKEQNYIIGRDPSCDIVLTDNSVSRQHAELIVNEKGILLLIDQHSTNGCFIHSQGAWESISQEIVNTQDLVRFGDFEISVENLIASVPNPPPSQSPPTPSTPSINISPPPSQNSQPKKPWLKGDRLVRCQCGAIKRPNEPCLECGL
jgi:pSer/pThr/pTyr-binding forkhead associated (FHA) protein